MSHMGLFGKRREGGVMDEIRCDETSYLVWKWSPSGRAGSSDRENAIRWGSSLHVREASVAVFLNAIDEELQDFIEGPYDGVLETGNLPVLASLIGSLYDGGTPFQAEVYFINLAQTNQVMFGVPFFDVFDPRFPDFAVPVAVRGAVTFGIRDYRRFVALNGLRDFSVDEFGKRIRISIARQVKGTMSDVLASSSVPIIQVGSMIDEINSLVEQQVRDRLESDYGVSVTSLDIEAIEVDKASDGYARLMSVTRDIAAEAALSRSRADARKVEDMQRIHASHLEESLRIQREEEQYAQRLRTREEHLDTYRAVSQAEVALAGADALGRISEGASLGATSIGDTSPADIMTSMAMGGVVAQNLASTMEGAFGSVSRPSQTPPPIPRASYHVAMNGQACGPYDMGELARLAASGRLLARSYVWTEGMVDWVQASTVPEIASLLGVSGINAVPPVPPDNQ